MNQAEFYTHHTDLDQFILVEIYFPPKILQPMNILPSLIHYVELEVTMFCL